MPCGPSAPETATAGQQSSTAQQLASNYGSQFGAQSAITSNLTNILNPIAEAGPDQQGFGANETAAINTDIGQGTGTNYAHADQALQTQEAGRGGGAESLPSGVNAQLGAGIATSAAQTQSNEQLGATEANYAQGRANFGNAVSGLDTVAGIENPLGYAGAATGANQAAFGDEQSIQQQQNQWIQDTAGLVGGLGSAAIGAYGNIEKGTGSGVP
jgi:hypothetical protein